MEETFRLSLKQTRRNMEIYIMRLDFFNGLRQLSICGLKTVDWI